MGLRRHWLGAQSDRLPSHQGRVFDPDPDPDPDTDTDLDFDFDFDLDFRRDCE